MSNLSISIQRLIRNFRAWKIFEMCNKLQYGIVNINTRGTKIYLTNIVRVTAYKRPKVFNTQISIAQIHTFLQVEPYLHSGMGQVSFCQEALKKIFRERLI